MLICWCFCGSFCTLERALRQMEKAAAAHRIIPVVSGNVAKTDTRFGAAKDFLARVEQAAGAPVITDLVGAEPIGPKMHPDLMVVAPCTGCTLAKIAAGISDGAVTLAVKSHLRRGGTLLLGLASNDALGANFANLATLYQRKQVYFLPLLQDDPANKPFSCVSDFERLPEAIPAAVAGHQLLPLFE